MTRIRSGTAAALVVLAAACGGGGGDRTAANDTAAAQDTAAVPSATHDVDSHGHGGDAAGDTTLRVRHDGMGPLRVGMTADEARLALGHFEPLGPVAGDVQGDSALACQHAESARLGPGVLVMLDGGRVVRVEVDSGRVATAEGARIGDTEARIEQLYPGRVTVLPHKYTDGHYLYVRSAESSDSTRLIVFETDGRVVERFRAGQKPQVEYVEGCA
jgi:hypothetical protein